MSSLPSLSVAIMTHPERLEMAQELQKHIQGGVIRGIDQNTLWGAAVASWASYDPACDYHLVIQDDVWANKTLIDDVRYILQYAPETSPVNLADKTPSPRFRWRRERRMGNARGIAMHTSMIGDFLVWCEEHVLSDIRADDFRFSLYCTEFDIPVYYANPPLVYQRPVWSVYKQAPYIQRKEHHIGEVDIKSFDWNAENTNPYRRGYKRPVFYDYATGKLRLACMPHHYFIKGNIKNRQNIVPYQALEFDDFKLTTGNDIGLLMPAFSRYTSEGEYNVLPAGQYTCTADLRVGHTLGGQNKNIEVPDRFKRFRQGEGFVVFRLMVGGEQVNKMRFNLYYNHTGRSITFAVDARIDSKVWVEIESNFWGNVGIHFVYDFAKE